MKTIRKYQTGAALLAPAAGAAGGEAIMTVPGLAIPAALAFAMYNTYKHPERTAMSRGMREAEERWRAAQAQLEAEERAQVKAAARARNKQLAEYYAKELSNGPIVRNYADGFTTTITGYDPNTGRLTTVMNDPNRGWTFEGTAPELRYNYVNGVNLEDELNGVVTTKYGTFTPEIDYVDWDTLKIKPGTLIEGLPGIALAPPTGLNSVKINPRAMVLSTGQTVALPSDITDYRVFDETADPTGDNGTSGEGSDNSGTVAVEGTSTPAVPAAGSTPVAPTPEQPEGEEPKKKRYRDRRKERLNRPEPEGNWDEFLRGIDRQGMPSKMNNPSFGEEWLRWPRTSYGLGYMTRFLGTPGGIFTIGGGGTGLYYLWNAWKNGNQNTTKSTATSEEGVETRALEGDSNTGTSNNGNVGTGWTVIPTYGEPGYNPTNSGGQNQGTTERQVINLSEMDSVDSLFNPRR